LRFPPPEARKPLMSSRKARASSSISPCVSPDITNLYMLVVRCHSSRTTSWKLSTTSEQRKPFVCLQRWRKSPVIYLTHHRHLCDIARKVCPTAQLHTCWMKRVRTRARASVDFASMVREEERPSTRTSIPPRSTAAARNRCFLPQCAKFERCSIRRLRRKSSRAASGRSTTAH